MAAAAVIDPVTLGLHYKDQLVQTADTLRTQVVTLKDLAESTVNVCKFQLAKQREELPPKAQAIVDSFKASIQDVETPIPTAASPFLQKTYLWSAVCLFASGVANVIGGIALGALVGAVFDTLFAGLLTFVALPIVVFLTLRKVHMSEVNREQVVLFSSVAEGALIGALFSGRHGTIFAPPAFLLPLSIGLLAHFAGTKEQMANNHRVLLGTLVGGALAGYAVQGFLLNMTLSYILSTVILSAAALVDLQLKLATFQRGDSSPQLEQWKTVVILNMASSIAHFIASTSAEEAAEAYTK